MTDQADFEDQDGNGIQVTSDRDDIMLAMDSHNPLGRVSCLSPDVAEALGHRLVEMADKARAW